MSEQTSRIRRSAIAGVRQPSRVLPRPAAEALIGDRARLLSVLALAAILVFAGAVRLSHINWDASGDGASSGHQHPDERFLTQISTDTKAPGSPLEYFDTDESPLNPYNIEKGDGTTQSTFVYGTLPLFLNKFFASHLSILTFGLVDDHESYDTYHLAGRALSALFDLGTIVVVFFIGWTLINRGAGLMAAFLYAASPFAIQNSHFFIVDPFLTFFATLALLFAIRSAQVGGYWNFALAGLSAGLAMACKTTALSLLPVIVLAIGVRAWPALRPYLLPLWSGDRRDGRDERDGRLLDRSVVMFIGGSVLALVAAFVAYRIAMPYAFNSPDLLDLFQWRLGHVMELPFTDEQGRHYHVNLPYPDIMNQHWIADQSHQRELLSGEAFPPNTQWIGRGKWTWPLQQMAIWGMGPALGIAAWVGVVAAAVHAVRRRAWVWLVPLAWILGYFGFMGAQFSLYMRYFLPIYPALCVTAAFLLYRLWEWGSSAEPAAWLGGLRDRFGDLRPAAMVLSRVAVGAVLALTLAAGLAFYSIYTEPITRVQASEWFYENVPEGSVIGHEHWDDVVPYPIEGVPSRQYDSVEFTNFEIDNEESVAKLLENLEQVDYIALASNRLSKTIPLAPALYPIKTRYYEALESGELGFDKVEEFNSFPEIFGVAFDDTEAEESFSVYDHPTVTVYQKTDEYSYDRAVRVLHADAFIPGYAALPKDAAQNANLYTEDVLEEQQAGGTWTDIFDEESVTNDHPLFFWLLALEIAAFALVPLAIVVFRGLPDRGFLLTKPLGVFGLSYLVYAPASLGIVDFTRGTIALALVAMIAAGLLALMRWRDEIAGWVRERWRFLVVAEGVYLSIFAFGYWLRMQNPDLWHPARGGEKPMDLAYLTAVVRTTDMSQGAVDPWNAGGYLNYYYYGQFISATVTKLLGIVPEVAYNLIVPMFFAMAAAATFSIAYNLADATRRLMKRRPSGVRIAPWGPVLCALLAVFLVLLSGNLKAVDVLASNLQDVSPWHPDTPIIGPLITIIGGMKEVAFGDTSLREVAFTYDWWDPSRALDVNDPAAETTPITEWPYWTFLFADLHAHLIAIPFALTAVGVGLGAVLNFARTNPLASVPGSRREREIASWIMVALLGVLVGALRWINSWDYPPFLLMGAAALFIGELAKERRINGRMLAMALLKMGVMAALTVVFFSRFAANYHPAYSSVIESTQTTELEDFLSHFAILLVPVAGFGIFLLHRALTRERAWRGLFFDRAGPGQAAAVVAAMALSAALVVWYATNDRGGVIALSFAALIGVALIAVRLMRSPSPAAPVLLFVCAMVALGLGLTGGVEIITLDGDIGRMNTVFKFYLHVWLLWGIAGAFGVWYVFGVLQPQRALLRRADDLGAAAALAARYGFAAAVVILLALALVFPYFGTRARLHDRFDPAQGSGINGMTYMDETVYTDFDDRTGKGGEHELRYERDAITWMREHIDGMPTTIEQVTPFYHYGSRISIYTGFPTVAGWDWHQTQQRQGFHQYVAMRQDDVKLFYDTTDVSEARRILRKYDVEWVIVGSVERNYATEEGIEKFNGGLDGALELAYRNPGVQIWHVIPEEELPASATAR